MGNSYDADAVRAELMDELRWAVGQLRALTALSAEEEKQPKEES